MTRANEFPSGFRIKNDSGRVCLVAEVVVTQSLPEASIVRSLGLGDEYLKKFLPETPMADGRRWEHCRLTADEWSVLSRFFFTCYGSDWWNRRWLRPFAAYSVERIPSAVLAVWQEAIKDGFFNGGFELRTAETQRGVSSAGSILIGLRIEDGVSSRYRLGQWGVEQPEALYLVYAARAVRQDCLKRAVEKACEPNHFLFMSMFFVSIVLLLSPAALFPPELHVKEFPASVWLLYAAGIAVMLSGLFGPLLYQIGAVERFVRQRVMRHGKTVARDKIRGHLDGMKEAGAARRMLTV